MDTLHFSTHTSSGWHTALLYTHKFRMTHRTSLHTQVQDDTPHFSTHTSSGWHTALLYTHKFRMTHCTSLHTQVQDDTQHFSPHRSSGWHTALLYTHKFWMTHCIFLHTEVLDDTLHFSAHTSSEWHIAFLNTQKFNSNFMWRAQIPLRIRFHEAASWTQNTNKLSCNIPLLLVLLQHPWPSLVHLECSAFSETAINDKWTANIHEWNPWGKTVMMTDPILWPPFLKTFLSIIPPDQRPPLSKFHLFWNRTLHNSPWPKAIHLKKNNLSLHNFPWPKTTPPLKTTFSETFLHSSYYLHAYVKKTMLNDFWTNAHQWSNIQTKAHLFGHI